MRFKSKKASRYKKIDLLDFFKDSCEVPKFPISGNYLKKMD